MTALVNQVVTNGGIANSMCKYLAAAEIAEGKGHAQAEADNIQEFIDLVEAQTGRFVSPEDAATLIYLAGLL